MDIHHRRVITLLLFSTLLALAVALMTAWVRFSPPVRGTPARAVYTVTYLSDQLP